MPSTTNPHALPKPHNPISPTRFALALRDLPISALQAKAAELLNSIAHLIDSNRQLREYGEDDVECRAAIDENRGVVERMRERVGLVKKEVESRGVRWTFGEVEAEIGRLERGEIGAEGGEGGALGRGNGTVGMGTEQAGSVQTGGRLSDEELRRRMEERMRDQDHDGEDGVHL